MKLEDIEEGRRLRAVLDEKDRMVHGWTGPKEQEGPFGEWPYNMAITRRDKAADEMQNWIVAHGEELLDILLGREGEAREHRCVKVKLFGMVEIEEIQPVCACGFETPVETLRAIPYEDSVNAFADHVVEKLRQS